EDEFIQTLAKEKLKFTPFSEREVEMYQSILNYKNFPGHGGFSREVIAEAEEKLRDGGTYTVHNPDFLTGANISVTLTDNFMNAVDKDLEWKLQFPDVENYSEEEMAAYNANWPEVGDVR